MKPYANNSGDSNIKAYEISDDFIVVHFFTGYWQKYTYTNESCGIETVKHMQALAERGQGLNSYISRNKPPYSSKC